MKYFLLVISFAVVFAFPTLAVQPDEIMADPIEEVRARAISRELRCLVCRNESIDDSNASLARDLRLLVRERIRAGDDDDAVISFVVARYGEYVLLKPRSTGTNLLLWGAGPLMLLIAGGIGFGFIKRRNGAAPDPLSKAETARLEKLLRD